MRESTPATTILVAMPSDYSHRQIGTQSLIAHGIGIAVVSVIYFRIVLSGVSLPMFAALAMLVASSAVTFASLTCRVDREQLDIRFGAFGWPCKRVYLRDIAGALPTRTALISGFGVRITTRGWLYSVSGHRAVIVGMRDGKQFLIGSDEPDKLADAINQRLGREANFQLIRGAMVNLDK